MWDEKALQASQITLHIITLSIINVKKTQTNILIHTVFKPSKLDFNLYDIVGKSVHFGSLVFGAYMLVINTCSGCPEV